MPFVRLRSGPSRASSQTAAVACKSDDSVVTCHMRSDCRLADHTLPHLSQLFKSKVMTTRWQKLYTAIKIVTLCSIACKELGQIRTGG